MCDSLKSLIYFVTAMKSSSGLKEDSHKLFGGYF